MASYAQPGGRPNPEDIGVHLHDFTQEERVSAFLKYKEAFDLIGELEGDLYKECAFPLMLKFVAQAYQGSELRLSHSFSNVEIFRRYLDNRLGQIHRTRQPVARQILNTFASLSIESGSRLVDVDLLESEMQWTDYARDTFFELVRLHFLRLTESETPEKVTFSFEPIRAFIYTTIIQQWHASEAPITISEIQQLSKNPLGLETIEFYFTNIDRGQTELLTEIAITDFDLFTGLTSTLKFRSSIRDIAPEKQADAYLERLEQFAVAHSRIKHTHFPTLKKNIRPYSDGDTGVWVTPSVSMFQMRACTEVYPQQVAIVDEELAANAVFGNQPSKVFQQLAGAGSVTLGTNELVNLLPQKFAWDIILTDLKKVISEKRFYEGNNVYVPKDLGRAESSYLWTLLLQSEHDAPKYTEAQAIISNIVDDVFTECKRLLTKYFPSFADRFVLHTIGAETNILIEVGVSGHDLITIVYAILPSVKNLPSNRHVVISHSEWKLYNVPLRMPRFTPMLGTSVGKADLDLSIGGIHIDEPDTIVFKSQLNHMAPVIGQVCHLIGLEANKIFRGDWVPDLWYI